MIAVLVFLASVPEEFTPCEGLGDSRRAGPWNERLVVATSADGLEWTRTGVVVSDRASVPNLLPGPDGSARLYYVTFCEHDRFNTLACAVTEDNGATWRHYGVRIRGAERWGGAPVDPTAVVLNDGRTRLYVTGDPRGGPCTYSAISDDGFTFELEPGERFRGRGDRAATLDPSLVRIGDTWHYFAGGIPGGANWHATSTDGLQFDAQDNVSLRVGGRDLMMANGVTLSNGSARYYAFAMGGRTAEASIYAAHSPDGQTWTATDEPVLGPDESSDIESGGVKDPAVVRLADDRWLMVYVTEIPGAPHNQPPPGPPRDRDR